MVHCRENYTNLDRLTPHSEHSVKAKMETEKAKREALLAALFIRGHVICRVTKEVGYSKVGKCYK